MGERATGRAAFAPRAFAREATRSRSRSAVDVASERAGDVERGAAPAAEEECAPVAGAKARVVDDGGTAEDVDVAVMETETAKTRWRRRVRAWTPRDVNGWLQMLALVALIVFLFSTTRAVEDDAFKVLSETNQRNLDDALASIASAARRVDNVTGIVRSAADSVSDFASDDATRDSVQSSLDSAAEILKSVRSAARDVRAYADKNSTRDNVRDALRKLGRLIDRALDRGLDEFD